MTTGRPTEFDRKVALEDAMRLFWSNGYEATSLADLLSAMGIGRQSLYNAFGDKHSLFIEAVKHYGMQAVQQLITIFEAPGSPLGNIRTAFDTVASLATSEDYCGCLVTNSIVELAPHNEEVRELVRAIIKRTTTAYKSALDAAVGLGEISADSDTRATARFLNSSMHSIVVMGKAGQNKAFIADIVEITLSKL